MKYSTRFDNPEAKEYLNSLFTEMSEDQAEANRKWEAEARRLRQEKAHTPIDGNPHTSEKYYAFQNETVCYLVYTHNQVEAWEILQDGDILDVIAVNHAGFDSLNDALDYQPKWADILRVR